jgi:hypothetical protein
MIISSTIKLERGIRMGFYYMYLSFNVKSNEYTTFAVI